MKLLLSHFNNVNISFFIFLIDGFTMASLSPVKRLGKSIFMILKMGLGLSEIKTHAVEPKTIVHF